MLDVATVPVPIGNNLSSNSQFESDAGGEYSVSRNKFTLVAFDDGEPSQEFNATYNVDDETITIDIGGYKLLYVRGNPA